MDLAALARTIDSLAALAPASRDDALLYGVIDRAPGPPDLVPLASGVGRELPIRVRPPAGLDAIAFVSTGWASPFEGDPTAGPRPSAHPLRRRMCCTVVVGGDDAVRTVLRLAGEAPRTLDDGEGAIHDALVRCWQRRRDAHGPEPR